MAEEVTKHAGGRPTVVTPELLELATNYIPKGVWKTIPLGGEGDIKPVIPTVEGLANYLGISRDTIYANAQFSDILEQLKEVQASFLLNRGLIGEFNPLMAKMILSSKHGYVEKSAAEVQSTNLNVNQDGGPADKSTVDELVDLLKNKTAGSAE